MSLPVLNGFSGSLDSYNDIDDMLDTLDIYNGVCHRMPFNPPWRPDSYGSRPWGETSQYGPSGLDKIKYYLNHSDKCIIVEPNHFLKEDRLPTVWDDGTQRCWKAVQDRLVEALDEPGIKNNKRAIFEIINEYPNSTDLFPRTEQIIQNLRSMGYTNPIIQDCHNDSDVWARFKAEAPSLDAYGRHWYMNRGLAQFQQIMTWAIDNNCTPLVNTEIGAHYDEADAFNPQNVGDLNTYCHWSKPRKIGNLIWMNHNLNNLDRYEALGFDPQWSIGGEVQIVDFKNVGSTTVVQKIGKIVVTQRDVNIPAGQTVTVELEEGEFVIVGE